MAASGDTQTLSEDLRNGRNPADSDSLLLKRNLESA
jgi:hypothetical protein